MVLRCKHKFWKLKLSLQNLSIDQHRFFRFFISRKNHFFHSLLFCAFQINPFFASSVGFMNIIDFVALFLKISVITFRGSLIQNTASTVFGTCHSISVQFEFDFFYIYRATKKTPNLWTCLAVGNRIWTEWFPGFISD